LTTALVIGAVTERGRAVAGLGATPKSKGFDTVLLILNDEDILFR
jgi:hypothetical protein